MRGMIGSGNWSVGITRALPVALVLALPLPLCAAVTVVSPGQSIQAAIQQAANGDEIQVQPGVYPESLDYLGKSIRIVALQGAANTILDATGTSASAVRFISGESSGAILEGFTLTGGSGTRVFDGGGFTFEGGGVFISAASTPRILGCVIRGNQTPTSSEIGRGGGISSHNSTASLEQCIVEQNASFSGGGFFGSARLSGCTVQQNTATLGGGLCVRRCVLQDCEIKNNQASSGGGIHFRKLDGGVLSAARCRVTGNTASLGGGIAASAVWGNEEVRLSGFEIIGNRATGAGGGAYVDVDSPFHFVVTARVDNCIIANNQAPAGSGVMFYDASISHKTTVVAYSTVVGNDLVSKTAVKATRSILWGASAIAATSMDVSYCDVQGGFVGEGNFDADPKFVAPALEDYRLLDATSPCVDVAGPALPEFDFDLDGEPRIQHGSPDVGADELVTDCNGNAVPDYRDLDGGSSADCNQDGIPDECQIFADCNGNSIWDACDILSGVSTDCDQNGVPDECGLFVDCDGNLVHDTCDIAGGAADCNKNGVPDECDIALGVSQDANGDGVPDECANTLIVPTQFPTIQLAINAAVPVGDIILVEPGTHGNQGDQGLSFGGKSLTLRSREGADRTRIQLGSGAYFAAVAGTSSVAIEGFTILGETSSTGGSQIRVDNGGALSVRRCVFIEGDASFQTGDGGAIRASGGSTLNVERCIFTQCLALSGGGAVALDGSFATIVNSTFIDNACVGGFFGGKAYGGAIFTDNSQATITGCILRGNKAKTAGDQLRVGKNSSVTISHCNIEGGQAAISVQAVSGALTYGAGNIDLDPQFVDAPARDFHLGAGSPCIDAGFGVPTADFEGDPGGSFADIGADEFHPHLYTTGTPLIGGVVSVKLIGSPGASPALYFLSLTSGPALETPFGDVLVGFPLVPGFPVHFGPMPIHGVQVVPLTIPTTAVVGLSVYTQVFLGAPNWTMTNLEVVTIE